MDSKNMDRREFVQKVGVGVAAASTLSLIDATASAAPTPESAAEVAAKELYETLSDKQKKTICFDFNHALRMKHNANWAITKPEIGGDFYTNAQRDLIKKVVKGVLSEDGNELFQRQMKADSGAGINSYHIAMFGQPGGQFEFELTGRHLTLRADGNTAKGQAFGGPLVYGHGESDPKKNLFYNQTVAVNEVFKALEGKQKKKALLSRAPAENHVPLQGKKGKFKGLQVASMSSDQKELVEKSIATILAPYRKEDVDEVRAILKGSGGIDELHMAFYQQGDLKEDNVWDIWRIEGPTMVWHFRGAPHVHAYINIGMKS